MGIHMTRVYINGFKRFTKLDLQLNPTFNVIVGDNETGKSSLLEAMGLVLTGQYDGRLIQYTVDPYLFHAGTVATYFQKRQNGEHVEPPKVEIEAYFDDDPALARLKGTNNTRNENCPGLALTIEVDPNHVEALSDYACDNSNPTVLHEPGLMHHSDQGMLYATGSYLRLIKQYGIVRSMSRKGNCYDNAVVESFFSSLKNEIIHHRDYHTREQARTEIFEYVELFYNRRRIHQSLDYLTPMKYESAKCVA